MPPSSFPHFGPSAEALSFTARALREPWPSGWLNGGALQPPRSEDGPGVRLGGLIVGTPVRLMIAAHGHDVDWKDEQFCISLSEHENFGVPKYDIRVHRTLLTADVPHLPWTAFAAPPRRAWLISELLMLRMSSPEQPDAERRRVTLDVGLLLEGARGTRLLFRADSYVPCDLIATTDAATIDTYVADAHALREIL